MVQTGRRGAAIEEKAGDALGAPGRRVKGDLQRFEEMIAARGVATGARRAEVAADRR